MDEVKTTVKQETKNKINQLNSAEYKAYMEKCATNKAKLESESEIHVKELVSTTVKADKILESMSE